MSEITFSLLLHIFGKFLEIITEDKENAELFIKDVILKALEKGGYNIVAIKEIDVVINPESEQIIGSFIIKIKIYVYNIGLNSQEIEELALLLESKVSQALLEFFQIINIESSSIESIKDSDKTLTTNQSRSSEIKVGGELDVKHKASSIEKTAESTEHRSSLKLSTKPSPEGIDVSKTLLAESTILRIRIMEEPLTTYNLTTILSSITELHTKCWLIAHSRFADLIEYTQTHNERFSKEANLVIVQITHNSPADIKVNVNADASAQGLAEALKTGIDAITQAPHRRKATELENQAAELAIKQNELEAQTTQAEREQNLQIAAQQAEINRQKGLLELQQQQIQVAKEQIGLDRERLELEKNRLEFALETADKMVDMLRPDIDAQTKAMLLQTLIPNLLQAANGQGVVIALPEPKKEENK